MIAMSDDDIVRKNYIHVSRDVVLVLLWHTHFEGKINVIYTSIYSSIGIFV